MKDLFENILENVLQLTIIDSHEHLDAFERSREKDTDILQEYLRQYFRSDLISVGLDAAQMAFATDSSQPLMARWKTVEPYWNLARNTGYGRALDAAVQGIYGAKRLDGSTIEGLNEAFLKTLQPGANHYRRILKDMSRIEYSVLDGGTDCDREFFRSAFRVDFLVSPRSWDEIEKAAADVGVPVCCLDDWLQVCAAHIENALSQGAVALKCALAYNRPLRFENAAYREAEDCFHAMLNAKARPRWEAGAVIPGKAFEDYVMHFILRMANRRGLVLQLHTGLQEGNGNLISHADPALLTNLFVQYPRVKFDLFHIGYPYQHVLSALGKMFPNVYLNMCWAHVISPAASVSALGEWLDSVPVGKIIAFGGDYRMVDLVYAHQRMARENVSRALAQKVWQGAFGLDEAKWMAQRMFYENPKTLYGE